MSGQIFCSAYRFTLNTLAVITIDNKFLVTELLAAQAWQISLLAPEPIILEFFRVNMALVYSIGAKD